MMKKLTEMKSTETNKEVYVIKIRDSDAHLQRSIDFILMCTLNR